MVNKFTGFLIVIALAIAAFMGGYFLSQKDLNTSNSQKGSILYKFSSSNPNKNYSPNNLPDIVPIGKPGATSPVSFSKNDSIAYFDSNTGKSYLINLESKKEEALSDIQIYNFLKSIWSPDKNSIIISTFGPSGNQYHYFNLLDKKSLILNSSINDPVFSPTGKEVAYFSNEDDGNHIYLSQPDGSSPKSILTTRIPDLEISWPNQDTLAIKTKTNTSDLLVLSREGSLKKILNSKEGLDLKWSPSGKKLLYSDKEEGGHTNLFLKNMIDNTETSLGVSTLAERCAWSLNEEYIVCAVARESGALGDNFYKIRLSDKYQELILEPITKISTKEILLSSLENYVITLSETNSQLYYIKLGE